MVTIATRLIRHIVALPGVHAARLNPATPARCVSRLGARGRPAPPRFDGVSLRPARRRNDDHQPYSRARLGCTRRSRALSVDCGTLGRARSRRTPGRRPSLPQYQPKRATRAAVDSGRPRPQSPARRARRRRSPRSAPRPPHAARRRARRDVLDGRAPRRLRARERSVGAARRRCTGSMRGLARVTDVGGLFLSGECMLNEVTEQRGALPQSLRRRAQPVLKLVERVAALFR